MTTLSHPVGLPHRAAVTGISTAQIFVDGIVEQRDPGSTANVQVNWKFLIDS